MVETEELGMNYKCFIILINHGVNTVIFSPGRLNSIQTSINSLLTFAIVLAYRNTFDAIHYNELVNLALVIFLYLVLTLPILYVFMWVIFHVNNSLFLTNMNVHFLAFFIPSVKTSGKTIRQHLPYSSSISQR